MWRSAWALLLALPVMTNGHCTPSVPSQLDCDDHVGLGSDLDLVSTPRPDPAAEAVALQIGGGFTAEADLYQRVVQDLTELRRQRWAELWVGQVWPDLVVVRPDAATLRAIDDGTWEACANERYGLQDAEVHDGEAWLTFDGVFDTQALALEYAALPGILDARTVRTEEGDVVETMMVVSAEAHGEEIRYDLRRHRLSQVETFAYTCRAGGVCTEIP